jgi:two-component system, NtrC family, nitrogen regulation sensor histidine kinase NtrY
VKKILKYILFLLTVAALGGAVFSYLFSSPDTTGLSSYLGIVKMRVNESLTTSKRELLVISDRVLKTSNHSFSELLLDTRYPYFVFKSDSLIVWSDHRFVPDLDKIRHIKDVEFVEIEGSKYLVSTKKLSLINQEPVEIYSVITLYKNYKNENYDIQKGYNSAVFPTDPTQISSKQNRLSQNIFDNNRQYLFSIELPKEVIAKNESTPIISIVWGIVALFLLGLILLRFVFKLHSRRHYGYGFFVLVAYLIFVRAAMLYFEVPQVFIETDLFNPKFYAASDINPTLGDFLLNSLVIFILAAYISHYYYRSRVYFRILNWPMVVQRIISVLVVAVSYFVFDSYLNAINSIYQNSQFSLDLSLSVSFNLLKISCLVIYVLITGFYFMGAHLLSSMFIRLNSPIRTQALLLFVVGSAIGITAVCLYEQKLIWICVAHGLYFALLYVSKFPRALYSFRYKTSIYFFCGAFFCSLITTYLVYNQENQKDLINKKDYGKQGLDENSNRTEILLANANQEIRKDIEIQNNFVSGKDALYTRGQIQQKLKTVHLNKLLDTYAIEVFAFNADGSALDNLTDAQSLQHYQDTYARPKYETSTPDVYFINDESNGFKKNYVNFININRDSTHLGHVVLVLSTTEQPQSVYPELLLNQRIVERPDVRLYSTAYYDNNDQILYSKGSYNYERKFGMADLKNPVLYNEGLVIAGYRHVGSEGLHGRRVVVSSPDNSIKNTISNFSFLFLILVACIILIIAFYASRYGFSSLKISYTTKIQILLNVAFFLPLLLVAAITLSVISANYTSNQENNYLSNTKNVAVNFLPYLEKHLRGGRSIGLLNEDLTKIARESDADLDVNFFDKNGLRYTTTQPLIYESGLLSDYINPQAFKRLIEEKDNEVLLDESLGNSQYRTAYVSVKSLGKTLGVLSIPYFDSKPEIDRQILEVVSSVLSIFAIMFLLFLILSYWASNSLTVPLRLMTQRIRKTNLYQLNQPIEWKSDDELGLMVGAYNKMLTKLEESKQELAESEKQSAWQEMARQVAHEIKNPLTPMKLTIQQMQRTMSGDLPQSDRMKRTMDSLIDQIDNISDIATSFSEFAKMPLPKNERFEITSVLNKAADLYADGSKLDIHRDIAAQKVFIQGDRQLMGRIITNLIINGIQSVPPTRRPQITLRLYTQDSSAYIEVRDNGAGIPNSIQSKVFLPNFSTKGEGSGLGLAIAKRGIEHAGGSIWLESEEDTGTSFFISLPIDTKST